jgi:hypothetical protein
MKIGKERLKNNKIKWKAKEDKRLRCWTNKLIKLSQSAKDRGIEFDLSFKKVRQLITVDKCYYTKAFEESGTYSRSVDRVDSAKGYIDSNVVSCTIDIN